MSARHHAHEREKHMSNIEVFQLRDGKVVGNATGVTAEQVERWYYQNDSDTHRPLLDDGWYFHDGDDCLGPFRDRDVCQHAGKKYGVHGDLHEAIVNYVSFYENCRRQTPQAHFSEREVEMVLRLKGLNLPCDFPIPVYEFWFDVEDAEEEEDEGRPNPEGSTDAAGEIQ
jgi:hypothetical protein